jgi:hypothetical protein
MHFVSPPPKARVLQCSGGHEEGTLDHQSDSNSLLPIGLISIIQFNGIRPTARAATVDDNRKGVRALRATDADARESGSPRVASVQR